MGLKKANTTVEPTADDEQLTTNALRLATERRTLMRQHKIEEMRKDCLDQLELCSFNEEEKMKRITILEGELNNEIKDTIDFLDQTMAYYDEVLKQYTPPEERSVDHIVLEIEGEFKKVYDIFAAGFEFTAELPKDHQPKECEGDKIFQKELVEMEARIEENRLKEDELAKEVAQLRMDVEKEKVRFTAHRLQKEEQGLDYQRKIDLLEQRIDYLQKPSFEKLHVADLLKDLAHLREEIEKTAEAIRSVEEKIKHSIK